MNETQEALIAELLSRLPENEKTVYGEIADFLLALGYAPRRQKVRDFVLSFEHVTHHRSMGKIGVRKGKGFLRLKFFACREVPPRFTDALRLEIGSHHEQYCGPPRSDTQKNRCGRCAACTGGGMGYYYQHPDGRELLRCGAYPIPIPDITPADMTDIQRLVLEQHQYFLSL